MTDDSHPAPTVARHESLSEAEAAGIDESALLSLVQAVLAAQGMEAGAAVTVLLGGDALLHELNREHRGVDTPTDVLSFPSEEGEEGEDGEPFPVGDGEGSDLDGPRYLGDIAISVPTARRQAAEAGLDFALELRHLLVHGLLHLLGHDHGTAGEAAAMEAAEEALLGPEVHSGGRRDAHD